MSEDNKVSDGEIESIDQGGHNSNLVKPSIKINQGQLPAFQKPTSRKSLETANPVFKGSLKCPECGSASYIRQVSGDTTTYKCLNCGHTK